MGFGLLLCGYFILTLMSFGVGDYSFAAYIIGSVVMANAALKLKDYCPRFAMLIAAAGIYLLLGLYDVAVFVDELFLWNKVPVGTALTVTVDRIRFFAEVFMHAMLLWSVVTIAADVEEDKIKASAIRNGVFTGIWAVGQMILLIFPAIAAYQNQVFTKILLLVVLVCYILNTLMLHACFRDICPADEDLSAPMKRSRFTFINKLNDKFDERSAKALNESIAYGQQKRKAREEKKLNKKNKK
ncbi:MAG: hypothetical protein E7661_01545 [Ruminococcaceae bacterium]|nr:hypothetical protein [Oscillospiraceae bacterium]